MSVGNTDNAIRSLMAVIRATFSSTLQSFLAGSSPLAVSNGGTGLTTSLVPAGAITHFAMSSVPSGYLECNGAAVSRSTYATLFAAIGTTYGTGDGSTTFNLPELRGEFIRGWDDGRGVDVARTLGSSQSDEFKAHTHSVTALSVLASFGSVEEARGNPDWQLSSATGSAGGSETRPRNVALLVCIKT